VLVQLEQNRRAKMAAWVRVARTFSRKYSSAASGGHASTGGYE